MEKDTDLCPHCGYVNELTWIICDACGERLPWAPPQKTKLTPAEMTDEQLAALFAPAPEKRELPFFLTSHGRYALGIVLALVGFFLSFLLRR